MCFGVRDAIQLAHRVATQQPLTILGDLVHNASVLEDLRRRGIRIEQDPAGSAAIAVVLLLISFTALMGIGAVRWYVTRHDRG